MKLSEMIAEDVAVIEAAAPIPGGAPTSIEALLDIARAHRNLLGHLQDFALDYEQATLLNRRRVVPLWGGAGAAARLYRWMVLRRRRPTVGMGPGTGMGTVTALPRQQRR